MKINEINSLKKKDYIVLLPKCDYDIYDSVTYSFHNVFVLIMFRYIQKLYRFQLFEQTSDSGSFVCWFEKSADDSCSGNSASGSSGITATVQAEV